MRWSQLGFGRTASTSRSQDTPRNLMGFKDGTANIRAEDTEAMDRFVWVGGEGPAWMRGGTYMVTRRIRMLLEIWDRSALEDQEQTIGRDKYSGAPLGGSEEFDPLDLEAEKRRQAGDPGRRPRPPRLGLGQRRRADPAPRLLLHRRRRREPRRARSRPLLHLLPARPASASSSRSSAGSAPPTRSTSTSSTSAAPSSRSPRAPRQGGYVGETLLG